MEIPLTETKVLSCGHMKNGSAPERVERETHEWGFL
jgi:hypothetical protein